MRLALFRRDIVKAETHAVAATDLVRRPAAAPCPAAFLAFHMAVASALGLSSDALKALSECLKPHDPGCELVRQAALLVSLGVSVHERDVDTRLRFAAQVRRPEGGWHLAERRVVALWLEARALADGAAGTQARLRQGEARAAALALEHVGLKPLEF
jgi:hypothetical protein